MVPIEGPDMDKGLSMYVLDEKRVTQRHKMRQFLFFIFWLQFHTERQNSSSFEVD